MGKGNRKPVEEIRTRDPQPQTRDPQSPASPPPPAQDDVVQRQHPVIIRVPVIKCAGCGHTVFREGGTSKPNISTSEMLRYRKCGNCGRSFYLASPMTPEQIAKYR